MVAIVPIQSRTSLKNVTCLPLLATAAIIEAKNVHDADTLH
jgi:hypothetical protein